MSIRRSKTGWPVGFGPRSEEEVEERKNGVRDLDTSNLPGKRFDPDTDEWREFLTRLPLVHEEAHRIGMHRTGHALHEAVRVAGYELADRLAKDA